MKCASGKERESFARGWRGAALWSSSYRYHVAAPVVSRVLSLNNPVFVDVDGDGGFTAPFVRAKAIAGKVGVDEAKAWAEALREDVAVSEQLQTLLRPRRSLPKAGE